MLILELMSSSSIGRVNVLPSIIYEAMNYYRATLASSVQGVKLFSLPFDRGVPLDERLAWQLSDEITKCKEHLGCLVVTAQHRNSLLLKQYDQNVFVDGLRDSYVDILDESDAILHHEFQLVVSAVNVFCQMHRKPNILMKHYLFSTLLEHRYHCRLDRGDGPSFKRWLPFLHEIKVRR